VENTVVDTQEPVEREEEPVSLPVENTVVDTQEPVEREEPVSLPKEDVKEPVFSLDVKKREDLSEQTEPLNNQHTKYPAENPEDLSEQTEPDKSGEMSFQPVIQVYKYDSDRKDCNKPVMEPWDMQAALEEHNVTVLSSGKGFDGLMYSVKDWGCRTYPPRINIFSIRESDTHSLSMAKELGFGLCEELEVRGGGCYQVSYSELTSGNKDQFVVSVYKYSNGKQCQPDSDIDIDFMEQELMDAKVVVYQRYRAVDGLFYLLKCGHETGNINVYVVEKSSLADVISMGYRECAWLEMRGGGCYHLPE